MVTEVMEGLVYINEFNNLAVPLYKTPFTNQDIGILMNKNKTILFEELNTWLEAKIKDGTVEKIKNQFIPEPTDDITNDTNEIVTSYNTGNIDNNSDQKEE